MYREMLQMPEEVMLVAEGANEMAGKKICGSGSAERKKEASEASKVKKPVDTKLKCDLNLNGKSKH